MMGIPPSTPPTGKPGSSGESSGSDKTKGYPKGQQGQPFQLPQRKPGQQPQQQTGKGGVPTGKKGIFDLSQDETGKKTGKKGDQKKDLKEGEELEQQALGPVGESVGFQQQKTDLGSETAEAKGIGSVEAQQQVARIGELIQRMVNQLQVGTIGGKDFASVDLKATPDVPSFFANTTLTLTQTSDGLVIRFSNFEDPQQQTAAVFAVEQNKEQLQQMLANLQAKNIAVAEMQLGNYSVTLPRVEALPPPFQMGGAGGEAPSERGTGGGGEGGAGEGGGGEGGRGGEGGHEGGAQ